MFTEILIAVATAIVHAVLYGLGKKRHDELLNEARLTRGTSDVAAGSAVKALEAVLDHHAALAPALAQLPKTRSRKRAAAAAESA